MKTKYLKLCLTSAILSLVLWTITACSAGSSAANVSNSTSLASVSQSTPKVSLTQAISTNLPTFAYIVNNPVNESVTVMEPDYFSPIGFVWNWTNWIPTLVFKSVPVTVNELIPGSISKCIVAGNGGFYSCTKLAESITNLSTPQALTIVGTSAYIIDQGSPNSGVNAGFMSKCSILPNGNFSLCTQIATGISLPSDLITDDSGVSWLTMVQQNESGVINGAVARYTPRDIANGNITHLFGGNNGNATESLVQPVAISVANGNMYLINFAAWASLSSDTWKIESPSTIDTLTRVSSPYNHKSMGSPNIGGIAIYTMSGANFNRLNGNQLAIITDTLNNSIWICPLLASGALIGKQCMQSPNPESAIGNVQKVKVYNNKVYIALNTITPNTPGIMVCQVNESALNLQSCGVTGNNMDTPNSLTFYMESSAVSNPIVSPTPNSASSPSPAVSYSSGSSSGSGSNSNSGSSSGSGSNSNSGSSAGSNSGSNSIFSLVNPWGNEVYSTSASSIPSSSSTPPPPLIGSFTPTLLHPESYIYIIDMGVANISKCPLNISGTYSKSSCVTLATPNITLSSPQALTFVGEYAYIIDQGAEPIIGTGSIIQCSVNSNDGSFQSCITVQSGIAMPTDIITDDTGTTWVSLKSGGYIQQGVIYSYSAAQLAQGKPGYQFNQNGIQGLLNIIGISVSAGRIYIAQFNHYNDIANREVATSLLSFDVTVNAEVTNSVSFGRLLTENTAAIADITGIAAYTDVNSNRANGNETILIATVPEGPKDAEDNNNYSAVLSCPTDSITLMGYGCNTITDTISFPGKIRTYNNKAYIANWDHISVCHIDESNNTLTKCLSMEKDINGPVAVAFNVVTPRMPPSVIVPAATYAYVVNDPVTTYGINATPSSITKCSVAQDGTFPWCTVIPESVTKLYNPQALVVVNSIAYIVDKGPLGAFGMINLTSGGFMSKCPILANGDFAPCTQIASGLADPSDLVTDESGVGWLTLQHYNSALFGVTGAVARYEASDLESGNITHMFYGNISAAFNQPAGIAVAKGHLYLTNQASISTDTWSIESPSLMDKLTRNYSPYNHDMNPDNLDLKANSGGALLNGIAIYNTVTLDPISKSPKQLALIADNIDSLIWLCPLSESGVIQDLKCMGSKAPSGASYSFRNVERVRVYNHNVYIANVNSMGLLNTGMVMCQVNEANLILQNCTPVGSNITNPMSVTFYTAPSYPLWN